MQSSTHVTGAARRPLVDPRPTPNSIPLLLLPQSNTANSDCEGFGPKSAIVLECEGELVADPVADADRGSEMRFFEAVEVRIENGMDDQVETAEVHADDGNGSRP